MRETSCCLFLAIIMAFNPTPRYPDDLLDVDNPYFEQTVSQIYPTELQLNKQIILILKRPFRTWACQ